jgi:hypothetical protein
MTQIIFTGDLNNYYSYDGELYTGSFPYAWAKMHIAGTGPKECDHCKLCGFYNGVFIGYCANCASQYDNVRGPPFCSVDVNADSLDDSNKPFWMEGIAWYNVGKIELLHDSIQSYYKHQLSDIGRCKMIDISYYIKMQLELGRFTEEYLCAEENRLRRIADNELIQLKKEFDCQAKLVEKRLMKLYAQLIIDEQITHFNLINKSIEYLRHILSEKNIEVTKISAIKCRLCDLYIEFDLIQKSNQLEHHVRVSKYLGTTDIWEDISALELELLQIQTARSEDGCEDDDI